MKGKLLFNYHKNGILKTRHYFPPRGVLKNAFQVLQVRCFEHNCPNIKSHLVQSSGVSAGNLKFVLNMKQFDCKS